MTLRAAQKDQYEGSLASDLKDTVPKDKRKEDGESGTEKGPRFFIYCPYHVPLTTSRNLGLSPTGSPLARLPLDYALGTNHKAGPGYEARHARSEKAPLGAPGSPVLAR